MSCESDQTLIVPYNECTVVVRKLTISYRKKESNQSSPSVCMEQEHRKNDRERWCDTPITNLVR